MSKPSAKVPAKSLPARRPSLKLLAEHLGLSPSTISYVLNDSPGRSIPELTRERVRAAAREFQYQPSMIARKLQGQQLKTVGILLPELGEGFHSQVIRGAGEFFIREGYFYVTLHHSHRQEVLQGHAQLMQARGVEGVLAIDTDLEAESFMPTVLVASHSRPADATGIAIDSESGAKLTLRHLYDLGHREVVFMRAQPSSTGAEARWDAMVKVAHDFGLPVREELVIHHAQDSHSPGVSYLNIGHLVAGSPFTAVICFNDESAMAVIRALHESGLCVPQDVSVVGYGDTPSARYHVPSLTTVRQPLQRMGSIGAEQLLARLAGHATPASIRIEPELVVRESTGPVRKAFL